MDFEKFKEKIVDGLSEIYGDSARIETSTVMKNNGRKYNGLYIFLDDRDSASTPVLNLDDVYNAFEVGRMNMEECVQNVYRQSEVLKSSMEMAAFAKSAKDWEQVKDKVFPILLSTEENGELLEKLVSTPILDLLVVYVIRGGMIDGSFASIKISKELLKRYGISSEQLHQKAMENMEKDGYGFRDLWSLIMEMTGMEEAEEEQRVRKPEMYVLTNRDKSYGAAGILNSKLIKEFAGDRDFIILPSSTHEVLFIPVNGEVDQGFYDDMVTNVNEEQVEVEDRLSNHSYYYDSAAGKIRMCA